MYYPKDPGPRGGVCALADCSRGPVLARGLCARHYQRCRRLGFTAPPELTRTDRRQRGDVCDLAGCSRGPVLARGLCSLHYHRQKRLGFTEKPQLAQVEKVCEWCEQPYTVDTRNASRSRTCNRDHGRYLREAENPNACSADGCGARAKQRHRGQWYCSLHTSRIHQGIPLDAPPRMGRLYRDTKGYIHFIARDGCKVKLHRAVMENMLFDLRGFYEPLPEGVTVHHKDLDRGNNAPSNLQLRWGNHGNGAVFRCRTCGSHDVEPADL